MVLKTTLPPLAPTVQTLKRSYADTIRHSIDDITSLLLTTQLKEEQGVLAEKVHVSDRDSVQKKLVAVLIAARPNTPVHMRMQLPLLAKKLDSILLRLAKTKAEYMDPSTLLGRLQEVRTMRQAKKQCTEHFMK
ncbi:unnamed protein product [Aphanomyces euteiches]|uniref:Uncharacterized protein n=1 Tax=Aphanomyces euteiches TaxID=100861 RepID=A0A6G0XMU6_9STRA|nr:hypothetical protein Ae201684_002987 [Aphanomyces euteiches]KAH9098216.1 hypothetical protein Ae201684P_017433 [Aphanomyces euteiches]KAH9154177.1 hypothetical protein AeRB84_003680 [Aphanomyces euteiches]